MKAILVPVDFSATAFNAAIYAYNFAKQAKAEKIILYNAFQVPAIADAGLAVALTTNVDEQLKIATASLESFKQKILTEQQHPEIVIETFATYNTVIAGIKEAIEYWNAALVIMGITGGGVLEQTLIGSNTIDVAKEIETPLLIVPPKAIFKPIRNTYLSCSFEQSYDGIPSEKISQFVTAIKSNFNVVHVETNELEPSYADTQFESLAINTLFGEYNPKYHFVAHKDFAEGLNKFIESNEVDILVMMPQKRGFFESIFTRSHTKTMAFHTTIPLLLV